MRLQTPTMQQSVDQNIASFERKLNQETPPVDKSFVIVLSVTEAGLQASAYKYATEEIKQNFIMTATGDNLDRLGKRHNVFRKTATKTIIQISLPANNGVVIPQTVDYTADANGLLYYPESAVTVENEAALQNVVCDVSGISGNLNVGDKLTIGIQIPGAERIAEVVEVLQFGAEREIDELYRRRILTKIRSPEGGGNTADFRIWAEKVSGVVAAFPYSGNPTDLVENDGSSFPPQRTVFIQADDKIDPDGFAPGALLEAVQSAIITNPETGIARQMLGLTNDTLFIASIRRTSFFVQISGLSIDPSKEAIVKNLIEKSLNKYFSKLLPYIPGLDIEAERNDTITKPSISNVVQDIVASYGGSVEEVTFGLSVGETLSIYKLSPGELTKYGGVTYV